MTMRRTLLSLAISNWVLRVLLKWESLTWLLWRGLGNYSGVFKPSEAWLLRREIVVGVLLVEVLGVGQVDLPVGQER